MGFPPIVDMGAYESDVFVRSDANADGTVNPLADGLFLLRYGFVPMSPSPPCLDAADVNDDGRVEPLVDGLSLLNWAFVPGNPPPPDPYPTCGTDPTPDLLGCGSSPFCP